MNIFILDVLATMAAAYHCDKHCVKMILETTQLLYTAWWFGRKKLPLPKPDPCEFPPYRVTHVNHPCAIWVRADPKHYQWTIDLGFALCKEYSDRYGDKRHKCMSHLDRLQEMGPPPLVGKEVYNPPAHKIATTGLPKGIKYFHCTINDEVWNECEVYTLGKLNAVETYRKYYHTKPWKFFWYKREDMAPEWYKKSPSKDSLVKKVPAAKAPPKKKATTKDTASKTTSKKPSASRVTKKKVSTKKASTKKTPTKRASTTKDGNKKAIKRKR